MRKKFHRRVAFLSIPDEAVARGVGRYIWPDEPWSLEIYHPSEEAIEALRRDPPDAIIASVSMDEMKETVRSIGCPVVSHSGALEHSGMPQVTCDSIAAGRMAADHFLERGFGHFGYVGDGETFFSTERETGFVNRLKAEGFECETTHTKRSAYPTRIQRSKAADQRLATWLARLGQPAAVFAVNDAVGWRLAAVASEVGIRVPEDVAILGMDDMAMCLLSRPPLSSVRYPAERVGYEMAALLDRLMRGEGGLTQIRIPPDGIVTRHSTDILAVSDPNIARALRFIATRFAEAITVPDVARVAGLNRRTMEKRFRSVLGRTPAEEIRRVRVDGAKELLRNVELSIDVIAEMCGFSGRRWMSSVFAKATGMTPAQFRRQRNEVPTV